MSWGLNLPLKVMGSNNVILFFTDAENMLTAHPCSSVGSGLDVLVTSYQKEPITFVLFCKIILIQSSLTIWELLWVRIDRSNSRNMENSKLPSKAIRSSRNPLLVAQKQKNSSRQIQLWSLVPKGHFLKRTMRILSFLSQRTQVRRRLSSVDNWPFGWSPHPGGRW